MTESHPLGWGRLSLKQKLSGSKAAELTAKLTAKPVDMRGAPRTTGTIRARPDPMMSRMAAVLAVAILAGSCGDDGGASPVPANAVEIPYSEVDEFVRGIEGDETGAVWYRIEYTNAVEESVTYLKLTDATFPLAITVGDCGIAAATYPAAQELWVEVCY
jgi:hypothetical protein